MGGLGNIFAGSSSGGAGTGSGFGSRTQGQTSRHSRSSRATRTQKLLTALDRTRMTLLHSSEGQTAALAVTHHTVRTAQGAHQDAEPQRAHVSVGAQQQPPGGQQLHLLAYLLRPHVPPLLSVSCVRAKLDMADSRVLNKQSNKSHRVHAQNVLKVDIVRIFQAGCKGAVSGTELFGCAAVSHNRALSQYIFGCFGQNRA
eukprot:500465-Amphidinium_carterae.1